MRRPIVELCTLALLLAPSLRAAEPKPAPKPEDTRPHVTLSWSTASEVDNFGYFVMRGENEKGPSKAINAKAIPGAGTSELPREYLYEDFDVVPGKTYWYYLESVSTAGVHEKFSPVLKRQCCRQVAGSSEPKKDEPKKEDGKAPASAPKSEEKKG